MNGPDAHPASTSLSGTLNASANMATEEASALLISGHRSKLQPPLRMAAARCAYRLASVTGQFDAGGIRAIRAAALFAAQFDHADELLGRVDDLDSPRVEATAARYLIQFKAKPGEEPAEHLQGRNACVFRGKLDPLADFCEAVAIPECGFVQRCARIDGSGEPVNADRQSSIGVPEFTDSPVRRGESRSGQHRTIAGHRLRPFYAARTPATNTGR
ncbi:hypothetical protein JAK46_04920 [Stenotrophomonas maltophilia]|nr:hypothetical protein [Stenotrophomonas maltophilia]MCU1074633.1 hypothetical protein [Stenotrophomonas maltophilia]MCU1140071.1 hypothetical protein [Stenotrophomonas maltophilia]